jgi:hypothetical protein
MSKHKWLVSDDIVAYYYYHFRGQGLNYSTTAEISNFLGMSEDSFKLRVQNVTSAIKGKTSGLSHVAKQTDQVVKLFEYARQNDSDFQHNMQVLINGFLK